MLGMDDISMHRIENAKDKAKKCKTKISMIPGRFTRNFNLSMYQEHKIQGWVEEEIHKYCRNQQDIIRY